jgi:hypothetical protein
MSWAVHVTCMGEMRSAYNILVGKYKGKRPLGRLSIDRKIVLEWEWEGANELIWFRTGITGRLQALVNTVMNARFP